VLHNAQVGPDGPPVPHARTWFPENNAAGRGRNANDDDSDDEVVIERATLITKCPLTLKEFVEPYVSENCSHVFEKKAILDYINDQGVAVVDPAAPGRGRGSKQVKCPTVGCEKANLSFILLQSRY
jgi:SUMO ligase MMS21 Smc5/6 complex component